MNIFSKIQHFVHQITGRKWNFFQKTPSVYTYMKEQVQVLPGVFNPAGSLATLAVLRFLSTVNLNQKTLLELDCGSGIISFYAESMGALVTASGTHSTGLIEISRKANEESRNVIALYSNLFENHTFRFDHIILIPPFWGKKKGNVAERSHLEDSEKEYFDRFFRQVNLRKVHEEEIWMALPAKAMLTEILSLAQKHSINLSELHTYAKIGEKATIYRVKAN